LIVHNAMAVKPTLDGKTIRRSVHAPILNLS